VNPDNAKKYGLYRPDDSFSVLTFSGETKQLSGNSRDQLTQDLSQLQADGGTYLFNAAQQAIEFVPKNGTGIVVFFSDGAPSDEPNPALVERYQRFTQQEGGKVIFVAVGNIDPDQVKMVASALSATPIYSQNVNETAQQFLKGIADAL
jgi:Mg-chelatase subunit ChlD